MTRRAKGEGSITMRRDGRHQASYVGSDGKRHYLYARTRRDLTDKLRTALNDRDAGLYVAGGAQTVSEFLARWLASLRLGEVRPKTLERYEGIVRLHVGPRIGSIRLRKLGPGDVARLYGDLSERMSKSSVATVHRTLHSAFATAVEWNLLARNPADTVKAPRAPGREMVALSASEVRDLLDSLEGDPLRPLYVMAVMTGMRQGELLGLRWREIDVDARTVRVIGQLQRIGGEWKVTDVKSRHGRRVIPLNDRLVATLRAHRIEQAERHLALGHRTTPDTLVFTDGKGDPINGSHVTERHLKPHLRRSGFQPIRFHDLRHTFASLMLSQGTPVLNVSRMLGHSHPVITLGVYAHVIPGDNEAATTRLDRLVAGAL